jgi:hypothetical protein
MEKLRMGEPRAIDKTLIEQLLTNYKKPEEYHRGKRTAQRIDQSDFGAGLSGRNDRSSRLREARPGGPSSGQHAYRGLGASEIHGSS